MALSLHVHLLATAVFAGDPAASKVEAPPSTAEQDTPRTFVLGWTFGLNLGVFPLPSAEMALFLGGTVPRRVPRRGRWLALGYKGAASFGYADALAANSNFPYGNVSPFTHRHHFALQGGAGRRGRLVYGTSVGMFVASFGREHTVHSTTYGGPVFGIEVEGQIGRLFGEERRGIGGAQLRLTKGFDGGGGPPWPTVGFFIGLLFGPPVPPATAK